MHKEHQRLVSDPQMDDLNVTLASKAEQQRNPQNSQRRQLPVLPPPTSISSIPSLYLFVCLFIVAFFFWFSCLALLLSHPFVPLPLSLIAPFYRSFFLLHTHSFSYSLHFSLMIYTNERGVNSAIALNVKWQAIATVHSHWHVNAYNKTQRLYFTMGDFALLF